MAHSATLELKNPSDKPLRVWFEPWGDFRDLQPGQIFHLEFYANVSTAMSLVYAVGSIAQDVPARSRVLTPSDLKWSESPRAPGVQTAPLVGDPTKPGSYVFRAKYPPNTVNRSHHHPGDEEITVLSGTLYFGDGLAMEPEKTLTLPAGSYIAVPEKTWHFLFTKSEPVEVEIRGVGPRANIFAK